MPSSISSISVNSQGIGNMYFNLRAKAKEQSHEKPLIQQNIPEANNQQSKVSADDILSHMAQSAAVPINRAAPKTLNPAQYVDNASAARIGQSMNDFEHMVAENFESITREFPLLSDDAAYAIAADMIEKKIA